MKSRLDDFVNRKINLIDIAQEVRDGHISSFVISQEIMPGSKYVFVELPIFGGAYYSEHGGKSRDPKSMGGKKPYVMLFTQELEEISKKKIAGITDAIGLLIILIPNISWKTGKVINKRSKKPLSRDDIREKYADSDYKFKKAMKILKDEELLIYKEDGYYISRRFIKKGAKK